MTASSEGKRFGIDRALKILNENSGESPAKVIETMCSHIDSFAGETQRFDDTTMMLVKYNANK